MSGKILNYFDQVFFSVVQLYGYDQLICAEKFTDNDYFDLYDAVESYVINDITSDSKYRKFAKYLYNKGYLLELTDSRINNLLNNG